MYQTSNMQRNADGKTLYITADPQEKGLPLCLQMLGQSKIPVDRIIIPYTQLWRVFPTSDGDSDSGATARLQNYTYKVLLWMLQTITLRQSSCSHGRATDTRISYSTLIFNEAAMMYKEQTQKF